MARAPSYPADSPVGATPPLAATAPEPAAKGDSRRTKHIVAGAAIGIGSAAIVAALLYANRSRKG
ncbi:MAG: hypothetical protein ACJ8EB_04210 [Allosphingosinicella sp.]